MAENPTQHQGCTPLPDFDRQSISVRRGFAFPGLVAGLFLGVAFLPAHADEPDENDGTEEITVTGSFIKQDVNDASMQVVTMDRDLLELQGSPSMVDLFKNLSASHGIIGENSSWYGTGQSLAESVSNVNLRGLGASRTLVLINGRRQVYVPARLVGGRFVDVNAIPQVAVERIDVLKEGAAAIYGSDAMGGVVNFHTRKDFDGFELSASHDYFEGAGDNTIAGIWGVDVGDNAHLVVAAEHYRRQELQAGERDWGLREFEGSTNGWSSVGNPGTFYRLEADGETRADGDPDTTGTQVEWFNDPRCEEFGGYVETWTCRFRYSQFDNLIDKQDHTRIFAEINGEFETGMAYHLEALYSEADIPEWRNTPSYPPAAWANIDEVNLVDSNHPAYGRLVETFGDNGGNPYGFRGRTVGNVGPARHLKRESETWRLSASVNDEIELFGDASYEYDLGFSYSHSESVVGLPAEYITRRFLAYRGYGGPNCGVEVLPDRTKKSGLRLGDTGGKRPGVGDCMYYNPFSDALQYSQQSGAEFSTRPNPHYDATQANSKELLDWMVGSEASLDSEADLYVFDLTLTGDVGDDLGGFAAGYQFRRFEAEATPNRAGDLSINPCRVNKDQTPSASDEELDCAEQNKNLDAEGNPSDDPIAFTDGQVGPFGLITGSFPYATHQTTHSFFGEWAYDVSDAMSMQLAVHYEEHDESSTFDPKAALLWDVSDSVTLRGSVQTTFRAPSVDDLNEDPLYRQEWVDGAYKPIVVRGDKGLDPEEALTYNIGMFAELDDGVELTLDYWKYIFDDPITATPHGAILAAYKNNWYTDPGTASEAFNPNATKSKVDDLIVCAAGTGPAARTPSICQVEAIHTRMINGPTIRTSGLDFNIGGQHDAQQGVFSWGLGGTYLFEYDVDALNFRGIQLRDKIEAAGYYNDPTDFDIPPLPRLKGRGFASYASGDWATSIYLNYISSYDDERNTNHYRDIDSFVTLDIGLRWEPPAGNTVLTLTVYNIADEDPPAVDWEPAYDNLTHDSKGRRFKLGFKYAFGG